MIIGIGGGGWSALIWRGRAPLAPDASNSINTTKPYITEQEGNLTLLHSNKAKQSTEVKIFDN